MTWQDFAALIGAVGGTIGAIAGVIVYLQSGSRVKVRICLGVLLPSLNVGQGQVGMVEIDPRKFKGSFGYGIDFRNAQLIVIVEARNVGRLGVDIESIYLTRKEIQMGGAGLFEGSNKLPHRFEFGTSSVWRASMKDAYDLAFVPVPRSKGERSVGAILQLGNGRKVRSRNELTPKHMKQVLESWREMTEPL